MTANGKLDRKALPDYDFKKETYERPETATEVKLCEIWSQVLTLNSDTIGIHDNFFELGGHSLKALELINLIYEAMQIELPLKEVFKRVTIKLMAEYIDTQLWLNEHSNQTDVNSAQVNENSMQVII
jgi:tyrocidine synthetase-3